MDPISIAAGFLGTLDVALRTTSALVKYARDTKNADFATEPKARATMTPGLADHKEIVRHFEAAPPLSLLDGLDLIQAGFYSKGRPMTRQNTAALVDAFAETEMPALFDSMLE
ncbi:MAG: hypothetical protein Q9184_002849 [Pyrenodesmia sp. 2 TL-2023]